VAYAAVKLGSQTMTKCHLINDSTVEDKEVSQQKKLLVSANANFF